MREGSPAHPGQRGAHGRKVHERGNSREVLEDHPGWPEGDFAARGWLAGVKAGKIDVGSLTFGNMLRAKEANLTILGAANQFVKEYAFKQIGMNKDYIKDNPEKATAILGTLIRGCAFVNDPANREEVLHVYEKVMRNKPNIAKEMYEIEVIQSKHVPDRCQATEAGIKAYLDSAFWTKSLPADTKVPPVDQIMFPEFYEKALAWYNNKGWMKN